MPHPECRYVDSVVGVDPGSDQLVAMQLRAAYEKMWFDHSVDMVWYGECAALDETATGLQFGIHLTAPNQCDCCLPLLLLPLRRPRPHLPAVLRGLQLQLRASQQGGRHAAGPRLCTVR